MLSFDFSLDDLQITYHLRHIKFFQHAQIGVIIFILISHQVMAVSSHTLHNDTALGKLHNLTQRIDNLVRMANAKIL